MTERDRVYRKPRANIVDFVFDDAVAAVFPDMIRRSVPGYELVVPMTGLLAARHAAGQAEPVIYDLGCSLGATTLAIIKALESLGDGGAAARAVRIRAVDNARAMLDRAAATISDERVTFQEADISSVELEPCAVVAMNYVLQFVPPADRPALLARIRASLGDDGLLLLSEKIRFDDPNEQAFCEAAHLDFKRANGYSELEISQKRAALEQVMIVDTLDTHLARLRAAGFGTARIWFRCLNWVSIAAGP